MVRLKAQSPEGITRITMFQFHYGSIKGKPSDTNYDTVAQFQFHYGSIKGIEELACQYTELSFNSTMVRLKEKLNKNEHYFNTVSIPLWFD